MKTNSILIKDADWIITQDDKKRILKNCSIYTENDKIVEIGKNKVGADFIIDGRNKIIVPGLINTHTHLGMTILRGYLDDMELHEWLKKSWSVESKFTEEIVYYSSLLGCIEMIKNGITCFNDMYYFGDSVFRAVDESGIRGIFSQAILDTPILEFKTVDEAFNIVKKLKKRWSNNERTIVSLGPHAIYTCSKETLIKTKEFVEDNDLSIHIHVSETKKEVSDCLEKNKKRPVEYLESIGILSEKTLAAHCCWLNEKEMEIFRKNKVKISHCPISNMKTTAGIAPIPEIIEHDVCVSLGTDSAASNNRLDLFQEMKTAALIHKIIKNDSTVIPAKKALEFSTINGAKALCLEKLIGSLEIGKNADIVIIDKRRPSQTPIISDNSIISHLVYSTTGNDVETVIIDGKIVMKDRCVQTVDEENLYEHVNKLISNLLD